MNFKKNRYMNKILIFLMCATLIFTSSCGRAQNSNTDDQIINMLKEFYIAHSNIWSIPTNKISTLEFNKALDSLAEIYCTPKLRAEAKKYLENGGYDLLTNEKGSIIDSSEPLTVFKDLNQTNTFVISYTSFDADASGNNIKQKVKLHVTVINDGDSYKIDSVR